MSNWFSKQANFKTRQELCFNMDFSCQSRMVLGERTVFQHRSWRKILREIWEMEETLWRMEEMNKSCFGQKTRYKINMDCTRDLARKPSEECFLFKALWIIDDCQKGFCRYFLREDEKTNKKNKKSLHYTAAQWRIVQDKFTLLTFSRLLLHIFIVTFDHMCARLCKVVRG